MGERYERANAKIESERRALPLGKTYEESASLMRQAFIHLWLWDAISRTLGANKKQQHKNGVNSIFQCNRANLNVSVTLELFMCLNMMWAKYAILTHERSDFNEIEFVSSNYKKGFFFILLVKNSQGILLSRQNSICNKVTRRNIFLNKRIRWSCPQLPPHVIRMISSLAKSSAFIKFSRNVANFVLTLGCQLCHLNENFAVMAITKCQSWTRVFADFCHRL